MSNADPAAHAERVEAALAAADARNAAGQRRPADVLAVEVHRLRAQLAARDKALDRYRDQLAEADARATTGGRRRPYDVPKAWANGTHAPPATATDPAAPPLGRAATDRARPVETVETGEEL